MAQRESDSIEANARIAPIRLSHKQVDTQTVRAKYKAGYGHFTVTSKFSGSRSPYDLFLELFTNKQQNFLKPSNSSTQSGQYAL